MTDPAVVAALRTHIQNLRDFEKHSEQGSDYQRMYAWCVAELDPLLAQLEQPDTLEHEAAAVLALTHGQQELTAALAASEARVQALDEQLDRARAFTDTIPRHWLHWNHLRDILGGKPA